MGSGGSRASDRLVRAVRLPRGGLALPSLAFLILLSATQSAAQPASYSAAEIRGWVVDAETKQPLDGVYVVAQWILQTGVLEGRHVTRLHIMETQTDAKGEYYFPAWGPKPRPFMSELDMLDPQVLFFKPSYRLLVRSNQAPHNESCVRGVGTGRRSKCDALPGLSKNGRTCLGLFRAVSGWGTEIEGSPYSSQ